MRDARPLVSVVIPCWNARHLVGDAIASALAQEYPHVEVIVVDDGSSDGSLDVIRSFGTRIRWESQTNRGGGAARNRGLAMARGELIQFLDADDLLMPEKLSIQVPYLLVGDCDIATCDQVKVWRGTGKATTVTFHDPAGKVLEWLLRHEGLGISAPLHARSLLDRVGGFDEALAGSQEYDLHLRLFMAGARISHVPRPLWTWREQQGSVSSNALRVTQQQFKVFRRIEDLARNARDGLQLEEVRRLLAESCIRNARRCYQLGNAEVATEFVNFAGELHHDRGIGFYRYNWLLGLMARVFPVHAVERAVALRRGGGNYYGSERR
jgi:glycosyltransferase involved in cell wall biosynthesis